MLGAARRMKEAGRDVVIGVLDLHGKDEDQRSPRASSNCPRRSASCRSTPALAAGPTCS
jgi:K+-sensing histidine kinase KdpD